ncbi:putative leucine-rich repeat domain, L domain-containing protein [Medicago truncatula]|uniref:Putative leucine-rich repeat domain, L domain-containing protein n=1 Tax=Medicago truncatula TaxID=3880 RepID=A0A396HFD2_MEDTR|nr:putative leucine-rich repeat domain, L domain-containing protein [Medicago truncatula]
MPPFVLAAPIRFQLHGINFAVLKLEVLNLSNTKVDNETLYMISKNCSGLLRLLLENCNNVTEKGVKHVVENCTQLRELIWRGFIQVTKLGNSNEIALLKFEHCKLFLF